MSGESDTAKKVGTAAILIAGCAFGGLVLIAIVGIVAAIAIPNYVSMNYKAKRAEIPMNLKSIKTAQLMYEQNFDVFVSASPYPPYPSKTTNMWVKSSSGGFATLDWQPDGDVRGSYWIEVSSTNFTATGISDIDGDGVYATYVATKSENPNSPTTHPDVY